MEHRKPPEGMNGDHGALWQQVNDVKDALGEFRVEVAKEIGPIKTEIRIAGSIVVGLLISVLAAVLVTAFA